jgi:hypothetical protein
VGHKLDFYLLLRSYCAFCKVWTESLGDWWWVLESVLLKNRAKSSNQQSGCFSMNRFPREAFMCRYKCLYIKCLSWRVLTLTLDALKDVAYTLCFSGLYHNTVVWLVSDTALVSCVANWSVPLPACPLSELSVMYPKDWGVCFHSATCYSHETFTMDT